MRSYLPLVIALAFACTSTREKECANGTDDDNDSFVDCADQDCASEPQCIEQQCDDGLDDDGDGRVDCDDPDCTDACIALDCTDGCLEDCTNGVDDDRDFLVDCADNDCAAECDGDGDGYAGLGGPDCDDTRFEVNPGNPEVPYDGLDNDCDPTTPDDDLDGDGIALSADCDDLTDATYPGAPETCGNGQLDDCDSSTPPDASVCYGIRGFDTADARFISTTADGWLGNSVSRLGDVDGDGFPEFVMGMHGDNTQSGAAIVFSATTHGVFDIVGARAKLTGESEDDWAAYVVAGVGHLGGQSAFDHAVGVPYDDSSGNTAGAVWVVDGSISGNDDLDAGFTKILGARAGDQLGSALASVGDLNGDGNDDLLVGAPYEATDDSGAAYVFFGPLRTPLLQATDANVILDGTERQSLFGGALAAGHDLDGDGRPDVAVGARFSDINADNSGTVYVFRALNSGTTLTSGSDAVFYGFEINDRAGSALAMGKLDDDAPADLVVGAPGHATESGAVYVMRANTTGLLTPFATFIGSPGDVVGSAVATADINGDGIDDLIVGAPGTDTPAGIDAGAVYVFFGPLQGDLVPDIEIQGTSPYGFVGQSVAGIPDWTDDGRDELIVGAPFVDGSAPSSGEVGVFWWGW